MEGVDLSNMESSELEKENTKYKWILETDTF